MSQRAKSVHDFVSNLHRIDSSIVNYATITKDYESLSPQHLKEFMTLHGLDEKALAQILGVTKQAVVFWIEGERRITVTVTRIIRLFEKYPDLIKEFK